MTTNDLRGLLAGGDRRGLASSARARTVLERSPERVAELASLTRDDDPLVVMRALDLLEKLARTHPEWVEPHKRVFIGPLSRSEQWEVRLQIVRAIPLFQWTAAEQRRVHAILIRSVDFPQAFVRAWALDSLSLMAEHRPRLESIVLRYLDDFETSPSGALRARARKIRARLARSMVRSAV